MKGKHHITNEDGVNPAVISCVCFFYAIRGLLRTNNG